MKMMVNQMTYTFNPKDYGYEEVQEFPEITDQFGNTTYIKVIAIAGKSSKRVVYWYSYCYLRTYLHNDDRWEIGSSVYDEAEPNKSNNSIRYCSPITSDEYARQLLMHIFSALSNESVFGCGKERLEQNINAKRLRLI
jgi:hypothetical protein